MSARSAPHSDASRAADDADEAPPSTAEAPAPESNGDPASAPEPSKATLGSIREPQRLHPLTLLQRLLASLPALLLLLFPVIRNPGAEHLFSLLLTVVYGVVALPAIILQYLRFSYRITPKQIVIQKGVFNRQNRSIPIERVQNIQIEQNLLAQLAGIAKVKIETAGSSATEGVLEYVGLDQAQSIRQTIRSFQRDQQTSDPEEPPTDEPSPADTEAPPEALDAAEPLFSMPFGRVLLSGAFRFSLLYIGIIFFPLQIIDPDMITRWILRSQSQWNGMAETVTVHPILSALATIVLAVLLGWITGVVLHLNRFYGFRLVREGDKLRKRHGLFTVTEGTIPMDKVQALIVKTNPLMRAFGWYELEVQTVGLNVDEQGHRVLVPFAQKDDLLPLARRIRDFELPETFQSVSPLTIRRMTFRYTMVLLGAVGLGAYVWPATWWQPQGVAAPWWALALIPLLAGWAVLQYRHHGYRVCADGLYIRRGVVSQYLWILPTEKFHVFYNAASVFQRRLNLKTLFVDTAGAATFAYPEVIDLPEDEADQQLSRLYGQFHALYRHRVKAATGASDTRLSAEERPHLPGTASVSDDASS